MPFSKQIMTRGLQLKALLFGWQAKFRFCCFPVFYGYPHIEWNAQQFRCHVCLSSTSLVYVVVLFICLPNFSWCALFTFCLPFAVHAISMSTSSVTFSKWHINTDMHYNNNVKFTLCSFLLFVFYSYPYLSNIVFCDTVQWYSTKPRPI